MLVPPDIEPADQGLCAGNKYVVEANNIGEILVFNTALQRKSQSSRSTPSWDSPAGDGAAAETSRACTTARNGGHWFFTEFVSTNSANPAVGLSPAASPAGPDDLPRGHRGDRGINPFGPYNVYFVNANYNPTEPGYPYLLNDFAKIGSHAGRVPPVLRRVPDNRQRRASAAAVSTGPRNSRSTRTRSNGACPSAKPDGTPNPKFNVAIENMGLLPTPDGTCASDNTDHLPGVTCWYPTIPAQAARPEPVRQQSWRLRVHASSLDFYGAGDNRIAVFDWTGLAP